MSLDCKLRLTSTLIINLLLTTNLLAQSPNADLLLLHGHILTVDGKDSVVQALAIRNGIIVVVIAGVIVGIVFLVSGNNNKNVASQPKVGTTSTQARPRVTLALPVARTGQLHSAPQVAGV